MKTKVNSFGKIVLIQFAIYTCIVVGGVILINLFVNWRLNNSFLVLDDFLVYEEKLKYEDYDGIPLSKFPGCDFAIYDNNNELIYSTDLDVNNIVDGNDLEFINDHNGTYYFNIFNYKEKNRDRIYKIYKTTYDEESDEEIVVANSKLDDNLNILEGDLFQDKKSLTERELELLNGYYNDEQMVEKYEFKTVYDYDNPDEGKRTLLFMSPMFNTDAYDKTLANAQKIWLIAIPFLIILILIETYFFNKKIKKSLNVLNNIIGNYDGKCEIDDELPKEFASVVDSFRNLMFKLKNVEDEKIKIYEDKQKVIANLSHDLKTPLTVIQGYSKAFMDDIVPENKKKQYLEVIYKKSLVAIDSIDSLFLYAHLNHPEYSLSLENVDIVSFSKNYLALKYNEIESNKMKLDIDIKVDKLYINMDVKAFRRIYENLINNSIKYNKSGTKIYFKMWVKKDLYISIGDNGVGIDDDIKDKIFDAFVTSNSARTTGNGTGLGLSIVKNLVEMHKGSIELVKKTSGGMKTEFLIKIKI